MAKWKHLVQINLIKRKQTARIRCGKNKNETWVTDLCLQMSGLLFTLHVYILFVYKLWICTLRTLGLFLKSDSSRLKEKKKKEKKVEKGYLKLRRCHQNVLKILFSTETRKYLVQLSQPWVKGIIRKLLVTVITLNTGVF